MAKVEALNFGKAKDQNWDLTKIVEDLRYSREVSHNIRHKGYVRELPSRDVVAEIIRDLTAAIFPTHFGPTIYTDENIDFFVGNSINSALVRLVEQVRRSLLFDLAVNGRDNHLRYRATEIASDFAKNIPDLRATLVGDLRAAYRGDPAATSIAEVLLCYRGMTAIIHYRIAHTLYVLGVRLLARLIADIAHAATGIDIHPAAVIGDNFFIDHGTGVVVGETTIIGNNVRLYQAVTLGAIRFSADSDGSLVKGQPRHPIIEDDVVIYSGATILGRITIGRNSVIGGNVWLTQSVPEGSNVTQAQNQNT